MYLVGVILGGMWTLASLPSPPTPLPPFPQSGRDIISKADPPAAVLYIIGFTHQMETHFFFCRSHMANIVTLAEGGKYVVDVGFGLNAFTQPHPLESGVVLPGVELRETRLL